MKFHHWWRRPTEKNKNTRRRLLSDRRMSASQGSPRVNSQNKLTHLLPSTPENQSTDDQAGTKVDRTVLLEERDSQI